MTPIIRVDHLRHVYSAGTPFEKVAIDDIDLDIPAGQFVGIIGHTGSGKSTFIQHLNGLLAPTSGTVLFDGEDIHRSKAATRDVRFQVGLVFQYPEHQIFAETVYEDIAFGPRNKGLTPEETDRAVKDAMAFAGLDFETFAQRSPFRLSGGQMRRVAIAGVVAMEPDYLILDEPSAGLDPRARDGIFKEIMALYRNRGIAVILVTHNMEEAARYATRLLVVSDGRIILDGVPHEIFTNHKEELLKVSMDVPPVYKLAECLQEHGLNVKSTPELADLERQILKVRRSRHAD